MSTKFEKLLDYLINEEHDKANELFHEIVVEKSRQIYENLIAEEEDEDMDEAKADDEENMDESMDDEENMDESMDDEDMEESMEELEDSYAFDEADKDDGFDQEDDDATGMLGQEIGADRSEEDHEDSEDSAMMDIKNAIQELEAAFAELEQAQGGEEADMGMGGFGDDDDEEDDEMAMGKPAFEGRRVTREYVEKVGNDWEKNSQKTQGQYVGANTGESFPAPTEGKSAINTNADRTKPTSGANAKNLAQGGDEGQKNTGTTPNKVNKGITPEKSEQFTGKDWETNSKPGGNAGVKNLKKVAQNSSNPGPVGSGSGDKAGQTSVSSDKPFLKKL